MRFVPLLRIAASVLLALLAQSAQAESPANAQSPLGINLDAVNYYTTEQPFLNIFKTTGVSQSTPQGWITHTAAKWDTGEEQYLNLDSNGYPVSLKAVNDPNPQQFTSVGVLVLRGQLQTSSGYYPAGKYVVLYDGQGTLTYGFDGALVSSAPGRDVINVAQPSTAGIFISIVSTDPNHTGNYIRNIRVVKAEEESALAAGQIFNPAFLQDIKNFRALRFMDWLETNGSTLSSWANRPQVTDAGWGSKRGVPLEVAVDLCNAAAADCWLNVPVEADDDFITRMATLVHQQLASTQDAYVEFSNEVWNTGFAQYQYAVNQGKASWAAASVSDFEYNRSWYGMRTAQTCDSWKSVWGGDDSRVHCVLGAQAANTWTATQSLSCPLWKAAGGAPCSAHNITDVAIAPYFGFTAPLTWGAVAQSTQLTNLFSELTQGNLIAGDSGGYLQKVSTWETAYVAALKPYGLPLIAYEGGQTFQGFPSSLNGSWQFNLYKAANVDPRMATTYTTFLQQWKKNGGGLFVAYNDMGIYTPYGEWGALQSIMETTAPLTAAPPKWQALQSFISNNRCWWTGCEGALGDAPKAPGNFAAAK